MLAVAYQAGRTLLAVKQVSVAPNLPQKIKEVGYSAVDQETTPTVTSAVVTAKLIAAASPKAVDLVATVALQNALPHVAHLAKLKTLAQEQNQIKKVNNENNSSKLTQ